MKKKDWTACSTKQLLLETQPVDGGKRLRRKTNLTTVLFCFKQFSNAGSAHHLYGEPREKKTGRHYFSTVFIHEPPTPNPSVPSSHVASVRLLCHILSLGFSFLHFCACLFPPFLLFTSFKFN